MLQWPTDSLQNDPILTEFGQVGQIADSDTTNCTIATKTSIIEKNLDAPLHILENL